MKRIHGFASALAALVVALAGCSSDEAATNVPVQCTPACGPLMTCKQGQCVSVHDVPELDPALQTFQNGFQVTAACLGCHPGQATAFMQTAHWKWSGPTPALMDVADPAVATTVNTGAIGKKNLINNFCVGVPSNEKRCDQCHAGYGGDPDPTHVQKSARAYAYDPDDVASTSLSSIPLEQRVDCLVCHADLATGYAKATANFGAADVKPAPGCAPACASNSACLLDPEGAPSCYPMTGDYYKAKLAATLGAAVQSIGKPRRDNCGYCHFIAGGGDGVKLMGTSLKNPSRDVDVHMDPNGSALTCADCHAQPGHEFAGAGIHVPAHVARASCQDCHGAQPHATNPTFNVHAARIACQTCHIPKFARGQFTKMDWDWSTAGDKGRGIVKETLTSGTVSSEVETYSFLKGSFDWEANIRPAYRWYDGRMTHATILDKADFDAEGTTTTDRITLGEPVGAKCSPGSKIHPFKLMHGRQAVYVDPASTAADPRDFVINPNVFGPAGLWGVVQSPSWTYDPAAMDALWSTILTNGARVAAQIGPTDTIAKSDGASPGWQFRTTRLYMDLNHEVAPKTQAIGAGGCTACHGLNPVIPFGDLGYAIPLPMANGCP